MPAPPLHLWRGEGFSQKPSKPLSDWITQSDEYRQARAATGRWFTDRREDALWYLHDASELESGARLRTLTLPSEIALLYRVDRFPQHSKKVAESPRAFSLSPETEYFLPLEFARNSTVIDLSLQDRKYLADLRTALRTGLNFSPVGLKNRELLAVSRRPSLPASGCGPTTRSTFTGGRQTERGF